jgi:hypothetical protein
MIKLYLPQSYEMLNGADLFVSDPDSKYKTDALYQQTTDPVKYEEYLKDLFTISKPAQRRFLDIIKNFLLNYTVCVTAPLDTPRYRYSRHRIIIHVPMSKVDAISVILGAPFFYIAASMKPTTRELLYTAKAGNITTFLLTKVANRPLEYEEMSPRVTQLLIAWFLKKYNMLTPQNISKHCVRAGKGFVNPQELRDVYETVKTMKTLDDLFNEISNLLSIQTLKQSFVTRYGIDVALLFDDIVHLVYNVATSVYLNYPAILSQYLSRSVLSQDANKIANSISSRLHTLPKF